MRPISSKTSASFRGFTLIELLTVIAIIGILAAILIPAVSAAKNAANRARSKTQFSQWATAMTSFKQEYGYYPSIAKGNKLMAANPDKFSPALTGKADTSGTVIPSGSSAAVYYGNIKAIAFYTLTPSDLDTTTTPPTLVDAFGNTDIAVKVDTNGDGKIDATDVSTDGSYTAEWSTVTSLLTGQQRDPKGADDTLNKANGAVHAGVIFYSAGKGSTDTDMVTTWQ